MCHTFLPENPRYHRDSGTKRCRRPSKVFRHLILWLLLWSSRTLVESSYAHNRRKTEEILFRPRDSVVPVRRWLWWFRFRTIQAHPSYTFFWTKSLQSSLHTRAPYDQCLSHMHITQSWSQHCTGFSSSKVSFQWSAEEEEWKKIERNSFAYFS